MRRVVKNINDSNIRAELQAIWDRINYIEAKDVEPTKSTLAPGEMVIYGGYLYINSRNQIKK